MERTTNFSRFEKVSPRRAAFLSLVGDIESQLRDAYDERHRNHRVTQTSIAKVLGVNRSAINHRLRGLVNMTLETLAEMVWALGYAIKVVIYDPAKTGADVFLASPPCYGIGMCAESRPMTEVTPEMVEAGLLEFYRSSDFDEATAVTRIFQAMWVARRLQENPDGSRPRSSDPKHSE